MNTQEIILSHCICIDGFKKRDMIDPNCQVHDIWLAVEQSLSKDTELINEVIGVLDRQHTDAERIWCCVQLDLITKAKGGVT